MMGREMARAAAARPAPDAPRSVGAVGLRASPFDFVGHMTAVVAILPVANAAARAMLPPGLTSRRRTRCGAIGTPWR